MQEHSVGWVGCGSMEFACHHRKTFGSITKNHLAALSDMIKITEYVFYVVFISELKGELHSMKQNPNFLLYKYVILV